MRSKGKQSFGAVSYTERSIEMKRAVTWPTHPLSGLLSSIDCGLWCHGGGVSLIFTSDLRAGKTSCMLHQDPVDSCDVMPGCRIPMSLGNSAHDLL